MGATSTTVLEVLGVANHDQIVVTERGTSFGYNNLVVDMRAFPILQAMGFPVVFDVTHSVQLPGGGDGVSSGQAEYIPTLAAAGVAAGIDALFIEVHQTPNLAKSDGSNALALDQLESLLRRFCPAADIANLAGATTLKQLAAVLSGADVLLTNDSGPMHLAAALGTPVVGVFTCTCPIRSGPSGDQHEFVTTNVPCAASYKKRCPYKGPGHMACMEELETDRVWDGLLRLMEKRRARGNVDRAKRGDST